MALARRGRGARPLLEPLDATRWPRRRRPWSGSTARSSARGRGPRREVAGRPATCPKGPVWVARRGRGAPACEPRDRTRRARPRWPWPSGSRWRRSAFTGFSPGAGEARSRWRPWRRQRCADDGAGVRCKARLRAVLHVTQHPGGVPSPRRPAPDWPARSAWPSPPSPKRSRSRSPAASPTARTRPRRPAPPPNTCPECRSHYRDEELEAALRVCPACGYHFAVGALERIAQLSDRGTLPGGRRPTCARPTPWPSPTSSRIPTAWRRPRRPPGLDDAIVVGSATIEGRAVRAGRHGLRLHGRVDGLGGRARSSAAPPTWPSTWRSRSCPWPPPAGRGMQENILALMQMAKTTGAVDAMQEAAAPLRLDPGPSRPPAGSWPRSPPWATWCWPSPAP